MRMRQHSSESWRRERDREMERGEEQEDVEVYWEPLPATSEPELTRAGTRLVRACCKKRRGPRANVRGMDQRRYAGARR